MTTRADILKYALDNYNTKSEHPWEKYPDSEILRHGRNKKWYALIMDISGKKVGLESDEIIDIMNVKCNPDMVLALSSQKGFFPAYHMNKQHWITIILDGTVDDNEIFNLLDLSYELTK